MMISPSSSPWAIRFSVAADSNEFPAGVLRPAGHSAPLAREGGLAALPNRGRAEEESMTWYAEILPGLFTVLAVALAWAVAAVFDWWLFRRGVKRRQLPTDARMRP